MPLDGHSYLVSQGWSGTGTGLRTGAISRPLAVPQKKNLAGLGKDRDEAFPFWDHLFTAAASAIKVKVSGDDDNSDVDVGGTTRSTSIAADLSRTSTGILSNRRPPTGTPATSGTATPDLIDSSGSGTSTLRLSLMAVAKRQAAQRGLYSRFFRGPVLGPDDVETEMVQTEVQPTEARTQEKTTIGVAPSRQDKGKAVAVLQCHDADSPAVKEKKRRREKDAEVGDDADRRMKKRRIKELKEQEKKKEKEKKLRKELRKALKRARAGAAGDEDEAGAESPLPESDGRDKSSKKSKSKHKGRPVNASDDDDANQSPLSRKSDSIQPSTSGKERRKEKDPSSNHEGAEEEPQKAKKSKKKTKVGEASSAA